MKGLVSCEIMNSFFPTGFPLDLKARLLWDTKKDLKTLAVNYFSMSFGIDGELCRTYMEKLSELFVPQFFYFRNIKDLSQAELESAREKLSLVPGLVENFRPIVERNLKLSNTTHALSWNYVFIHMDLARLLSLFLLAFVEGKTDVANSYWIKVVEYTMVNEERLSSVFDLWWFNNAFSRKLSN
jgi:hypothetical protein